MNSPSFKLAKTTEEIRRRNLMDYVICGVGYKLMDVSQKKVAGANMWQRREKNPDSEKIWIPKEQFEILNIINTSGIIIWL